MKVVLVYTIIVFMAIASELSGSGMRPAVGVGIDRDFELTMDNPVSFEYFIRSSLDLGIMNVKVTTFGDLGYADQTEWNVELKKDDSIIYVTELIIPKNDTSGLQIVVTKDGNRWNAFDIYFVTTGDTIQTFSRDPRTITQAEVRVPDYSDRLPHERPGFKPGVKESSHHVTDTEKKARMEREPLTHADNQAILVDGETWARSRGEYKFHKMKSSSDPHGDIKRRSAEYYELNKHREQDISLDLRKPEDYNFVEELVGRKLEEMDSVGYYHGMISKENLNKIQDHGILYSNYPKFPQKIKKRSKEQQDMIDSILQEMKSKKEEPPPRSMDDILFSCLDIFMGP